MAISYVLGAKRDAIPIKWLCSLHLYKKIVCDCVGSNYFLSVSFFSIDFSVRKMHGQAVSPWCENLSKMIIAYWSNSRQFIAQSFSSISTNLSILLTPAELTKQIELNALETDMHADTRWAQIIVSKGKRTEWKKKRRKDLFLLWKQTNDKKKCSSAQKVKQEKFEETPEHSNSSKRFDANGSMPFLF